MKMLFDFSSVYTYFEHVLVTKLNKLYFDFQIVCSHIEHQTRQNSDLNASLYVLPRIVTNNLFHGPQPTWSTLLSLLAALTNDIVRIVDGTECHSHQGESANC